MSALSMSNQLSLFDGGILRKAVLSSVRKLNPVLVAKNPVMFVVEVGSLLTTLLWLRDVLFHPAGMVPAWFSLNISIWLWFTVLFANFAEAVAEGRGKAQADTLRKMRQETMARKLRAYPIPPEVIPVAEGRGKAQADTLRKMRQQTMARKLRTFPIPAEMIPLAAEESIPAARLRKGDHVVVEAGGLIPGDGEIVQGIASVDESAITGESAPVIRESGGDRSAVTGGTKVLSDRW